MNPAATSPVAVESRPALPRLFPTRCARVLRTADDAPFRWVQTCALEPDHDGPCAPTRWEEA